MIAEGEPAPDFELESDIASAMIVIRPAGHAAKVLHQRPSQETR